MSSAIFSIGFPAVSHACPFYTVLVNFLVDFPRASDALLSLIGLRCPCARLLFSRQLAMYVSFFSSLVLMRYTPLLFSACLSLSRL